MARFSKDRWPADGPVLALLSYLDSLHAGAGRPSLAEMGRAVALAPSTLSAFFTGARLIGRGNLELLVEHLDGDIERAESLRRRAVLAWNASQQEAAPREPAAEVMDEQLSARLEIVLYDTPVNKLNRPEQLIGRRDLADQISPLLDRGAQVLLYGMAGSGKTALAATLADQRIEAGTGPYLWLRHGVADPDLVLDALVRGLTPKHSERGTGDTRVLAVRDLIGRLGLGLCVIDDAWQAEALHTLLRAMPDGLPVIVTSRLKLGLDHHFEVAGLSAVDGVRLLSLHAKDEACLSEPQAARLCADLGHHPYAIEIAGHHLRQYGATPGELRAQITDAPHDLAMPGGFAASGRESIRRLLDNTWSTLDDAFARDVLRAFGAFHSPGATVDLLAIHLNADPTRVLAGLHALVDLSLAKRLPGSRYYAIHDLTHSYVSIKDKDLAAVGEFVKRYRADHDLLESEMSNVVAAAGRARECDPDAFLDIVESIAGGGYLDLKGHTFGVLRLLDDAIDLLRRGGDVPRLHLLLSKRGNAHYHQGDLESAQESYQEALDLAPTVQRKVVLLSVLGKVLSMLDRHEQAEAHFDQAYAIADDRALLHVLEQHNVAAFARRDYRRVRELTLRGIGIAQNLGMRRFEAFFLNNLGTAEFELGVCAAIERHEQAQAIALATGDDNLLALTHHALGIDRHAQESAVTARKHLSEALRLYEKLGQTERHTGLRQMMNDFGYFN
ncbi:tetratricopeptide repeat protein [Allorhizocola rhizosphaerae]|uniref:tetratricopeptide repeat protein n=1 Tax=Allorhizocola rhizosphaerae TaxID=1872709 RepID=UPI0013C2BC7A|nr:tetratricopeptide repeat protein [Allorhizocola rhizosphaerae]